MLRAVLALLLIAAVGGLGYYFWTQSTTTEESATRARTQPAAVGSLPEVPNVDTGSGASRAVVPHTQELGAPNLGILGGRELGLPIANLRSEEIIDTFDQSRDNGERRHEATDILAPRGTPVVAVDDGVIKKLFTSVPGGLTIYQYDPTSEYSYYYAHLDRYAEGLKEGQQVRRGDLIGYVGTSGNADPNTPHLHFAILQLGASKEWWHDTTPINPYPIFMTAMVGSRSRR